MGDLPGCCYRESDKSLEVAKGRAAYSVRSPPPCGEELGMGVRVFFVSNHTATSTPLPSPPPQGGREQSGARGEGKKLCRRLGQRIDDSVDNFLDEHLVLALTHHADHRLGAGRADDQPALPVEPRHRALDRGLHLGILKRSAIAVAHVLEHLRQRLESMTHFRDRAPMLL